MYYPLKSKGRKGVTVQLTNSHITQTGIFTLSGESVEDYMTHTRVTRLSKTCRMAKYSLDPQGHAGGKNKRNFLACVHPG